MSEAAGTKRSVEGGNNAWGGGKKSRGDTVTLRFLLKSKHAGGIIGKGGETIKRLRSDFSASVTVPDTNTGERVLSIGAEKDDCIKVLRECLPLMHEPPYAVNTGGQGRGGEPKEPSPFEVDFLVHSSQVGGIIGRGGARIKQLREETSASVKVYQECLADSTERVVAIGGEEEQLVAALQQMLEVMQEQPIKGNITLYDPSYDHSQSGFDNFDNFNNSFNGPPGRGGMGGGMRGGNRGGPRGGPRGGGGMGGGMGGPGGRGGGNFGMGPQGGFGGGGMGQQQDFGNNFGNDNFSNFSSQGPPQGDGSFGGGAGGNFNGGGGNFGGAGGGNQGNAAATTTQVTIPNDMAGAIIGKGGERIRGIRQKCGADIKFSDSDPGKKDRLITINGTQDQIQYAQYLMQQCVRQNHHT